MRLNLEALQHIAAANDPMSDKFSLEDKSGICSQYFRKLWNKGLIKCPADTDKHEITLRKAMSLWPKYSGNPVFPVPSPDPYVSECDAYLETSEGRWDRGTEYGALRWELLKFLTELAEKGWDDAA